MPGAILYCDSCSELVSPADVTSGRAYVTEETVLCATCAAKAPRQEKPKQPPPPRAVASTRRAAASRDARRAGGASISGRSRRAAGSSRQESGDPQDKSKTGILVAGAVAGVLAGIGLVVVLSSRSQDEDSPPPTTVPVARDPAATTTAPVAFAEGRSHHHRDLGAGAAEAARPGLPVADGQGPRDGGRRGRRGRRRGPCRG